MPEGQGVGSHSWLYAENSKPVLEIQSTCITNSKLVLPFKMRSDCIHVKSNSSWLQDFWISLLLKKNIFTLDDRAFVLHKLTKNSLKLNKENHKN